MFTENNYIIIFVVKYCGLIDRLNLATGCGLIDRPNFVTDCGLYIGKEIDSVGSEGVTSITGKVYMIWQRLHRSST